MSKTPYRAGRHFLQIPGPTPVPGRIERAMLQPIIDHRSQQFAEFSSGLLESLKSVFKTVNPVIMFPASGTGAWEAALTNTLSPGDKVLMFETGQFSMLWEAMAKKLGLKVDYIESDWRIGVDANAIADRINADKAHEFKAVAIVHNETATGCCSPVEEVRKALDAAGHPALLLVDTVSSLGCVDYRHDEWGSTLLSVVLRRVLCCRQGSPLPRSAKKRWKPTGRPNYRAPSSRGRTCWGPTSRVFIPTRRVSR